MLKLCMVYSPTDSKLHKSSYVSVFRNEFDALVERFDSVQYVNDDCSAGDIDADLIFFFDPHAQHHIKIDGIENHKALKIELWNDPHQWEVRGTYQYSGLSVHKLGREQRAIRTRARGIDYIICPAKYTYLEFFERYFGEDTEKMLIHFPQAPKIPENVSPLRYRERSVLGNGITNKSAWRNSYTFRAWAHKQPYIKSVPHWLRNKDAPMGRDFISWISQHAGLLALSEPCPVPKYYEGPAAGCVTFVRFQPEHRELGFKDLENCIYVDEKNFKKRIIDFLNHAREYQPVADAGRKLMMEKYSDKCFAEMVYHKTLEHK